MITLATLHLATTQEVFDQAAAHLLNQNAKSEYCDTCRYKDNYGRKCAAGCFISAKEYSANSRVIEGCNWSGLVEASIAPVTHRRLICDLQELHDSYPATMWCLKLENIARRYDLSDAILN